MRHYLLIVGKTEREKLTYSITVVHLTLDQSVSVRLRIRHLMARSSSLVRMTVFQAVHAEFKSRTGDYAEVADVEIRDSLRNYFSWV